MMPRKLSFPQYVALLGGWRWYFIYKLHLDDAWAWVERVIYCHHNARVLCDMEYRFGCVLNYCTHTMSKAYYDVDDMYRAIDEYIDDRVQDGIAEAVNDGELRRCE